MSQVQSEITRLKNEARQTLATIIAEQALSMEAKAAFAQREADKYTELSAKYKKIDVNDKEAVEAHFGMGYGVVMYELDGQAINTRSLIDRL